MPMKLICIGQLKLEKGLEEMQLVRLLLSMTI